MWNSLLVSTGDNQHSRIVCPRVDGAVSPEIICSLDVGDNLALFEKISFTLNGIRVNDTVLVVWFWLPILGAIVGGFIVGTPFSRLGSSHFGLNRSDFSTLSSLGVQEVPS